MLFIIFFVISSVLIHIKAVGPSLFISDFLHYDSSFPVSQLQCAINEKPAFFFFKIIFSFVFLWIVQMNSWIIFSNVKVKCSRVMKHNLIMPVHKAHKICRSSSATCTLIETTSTISRKTRRRLLFFRLVAGFHGFASCLPLDFPGYMHDSRSMIL